MFLKIATPTREISAYFRSYLTSPEMRMIVASGPVNIKTMFARLKLNPIHLSWQYARKNAPSSAKGVKAIRVKANAFHTMLHVKENALKVFSCSFLTLFFSEQSHSV